LTDLVPVIARRYPPLECETEVSSHTVCGGQ